MYVVSILYWEFMYSSYMCMYICMRMCISVGINTMFKCWNETGVREALTHEFIIARLKPHPLRYRESFRQKFTALPYWKRISDACDVCVAETCCTRKSNNDNMLLLAESDLSCCNLSQIEVQYFASSIIPDIILWNEYDLEQLGSKIINLTRFHNSVIHREYTRFHNSLISLCG